MVAGLGLCTAALAVAGYQVWKQTPPFEPGEHESGYIVQASAGDSAGPHLAGCPVFPADNVWNTPIDQEPLDPHSADYIASFGVHPLRPEFGTDPTVGIPFSEIPRGTKPVKITFDYRDDSDLGNYPIPPNPPIEGGAASTGDRHILLIDPRKCLLYEIYDAHPQPDGTWKAAAGIKMDLTSNALRPDGHTSGDAAGLPMLPGLVRFDEVEAGAINHALRFTIQRTRNTYVWPGRHMASHNSDPHLPPMATRFRLRANFDISHFPKADQVILTALKRYGMFLADNGLPMFLTGVPDKRWNDSDLIKLEAVKSTDFEAVDESDWQMLADSARVDPLGAPKR